MPVRKRGPVRMQHEGLRRRKRSPAQGSGTPPTATFDGESGWVRASLHQSGATRPGSGKPQPFQTCGRRGKSRQSEVQKEKVGFRQRIRRWGTLGLCARARRGQSQARTERPPGLCRLGGPALSGCPVPARRGRVSQLLGQSEGAAGRMRTAADARSEGEAWARPRPRIYKGEVWTDARSRRLGCPGGANPTAPPAADVRHAEPCFAVPSPGLGG